MDSDTDAQWPDTDPESMPTFLRSDVYPRGTDPDQDSYGRCHHYAFYHSDSSGAAIRHLNRVDKARWFDGFRCGVMLGVLIGFALLRFLVLLAR